MYNSINKSEKQAYHIHKKSQQYINVLQYFKLLKCEPQLH